MKGGTKIDGVSFPALDDELHSHAAIFTMDTNSQATSIDELETLVAQHFQDAACYTNEAPVHPRGPRMLSSAPPESHLCAIHWAHTCPRTRQELRQRNSQATGAGPDMRNAALAQASCSVPPTTDHRRTVSVTSTWYRCDAPSRLPISLRPHAHGPDEGRRDCRRLLNRWFMIPSLR